jgi:rhodanese-related sulfurtransferase
MKTLQEVELGKELTSNYNADTESLNKYQAAICLCRHGQRRGSFLHFATAAMDSELQRLES